MKMTKRLRKLGLLITFISISHYTVLASSSLPPISSTLPSEINTNKDTEVTSYNPSLTNELLLPRNLYILQGTNASPERFTIFYRNALLSLTPTSPISTSSPYGQVAMGRWFYRTLEPALTPFEPFELSMTTKLQDQFVTKKVNVELVNTTNTNPVRLLAIGDSLTRAGVYLSQIEKKLPNVSFLGTRFYPTDNMPAREGRGGWTLEKYFTSINSDELDSPFLFPKGVAAERYKGNTRDWKQICYQKPNTAAYGGFQKLARGWKDEGEFLYDTNGYYKYPSVGDVMVDPSLPVGSQWIEWNGYYWQTMAVQPTEFEFSFSKYMSRNKVAFSKGTPTHVSILLGANDFGFQKQIDKMDLFIKRLNDMIDSIHEFDSNIKIILCLPTVGPNPEQITSSNKSFYEEYNLYVKSATAQLLKAFDTDETLARQIYIAPMNLTLDPALGFDYVEKVETTFGSPSTVIDVKNSIHPNNTVGQLQMGDTLAAVIQKFR